MTEDTKKKPEEDKKGDEKKPEKQEEVAKPLTPAQVLRGNVLVLDRAVKAKDTRLLMGRVMRQTASIRRHLDASLLVPFFTECLANDVATKSILLSLAEKLSPLSPLPSGTHQDADVEMQDAPIVPIAASSDKDAAAAATAAAATVVKPSPLDSIPPSSLPEVECYCHLLTLMALHDRHDYVAAQSLSSSSSIQLLSHHNRRTLDVIGARLLHYHALATERLPSHTEASAALLLRPSLLALYRTATLRRDEVTSETLLNLLLRGYLANNEYRAAEQLRSRAPSHSSTTPRSSQQHARYLFYLGRIRAIQLGYSEAKECLAHAARRGPLKAHGFQIVVSKWLVLVRLLLGEIPDRSEFSITAHRVALAPYFALTQAVRRGDLASFGRVTEVHGAVFAHDQTALLMDRLRHNVIRTGLRRISLAYRRISFADVKAKLGLTHATETDVELIIAKAIRDGALDATLHHATKTMESKAMVNQYHTTEPQGAFHARVAFCLDLHNEAVRAMRYEEEVVVKNKGGKDRELGDEDIERAIEMMEDDF